MGRQRERSRKSDVSCEPSATATSTLGTSLLTGPSTPRIPFINNPLDSLPSSACSVSSHLCSPGTGNHQMYLQWFTGSEKARGSGTKYTTIFDKLWAGANWQQTCDDPTLLLTNLVRRSGCPHRTSYCVYPVRSSLPDTWPLRHPEADQPSHVSIQTTPSIQDSSHLPRLTSQTLSLSIHTAWPDHGNPSPADSGGWSGLRGQNHLGFPTPWWSAGIPRRLGGVWTGGEVMDSQRRHPGSSSNGRIPLELLQSPST